MWDANSFATFANGKPAAVPVEAAICHLPHLMMD